jgi:hypothetical protein
MNARGSRTAGEDFSRDVPPLQSDDGHEEHAYAQAMIGLAKASSAFWP